MEGLVILRGRETAAGKPGRSSEPPAGHLAVPLEAAEASGALSSRGEGSTETEPLDAIWTPRHS